MPGFDQPGEPLGIPHSSQPPLGPHPFERQAGSRIGQRREKRPQILRTHPMLGSSRLGRHRAGEEAIPFGQCGRQTGHQRQSSAGVGVEGDALEVDARGSRINRVAGIDLADAGQGLLCPVALHGRWAEADPLRGEDGMRSDIFGSSKIFLHHLRRHHQRLADIREAFPGGAIDRKLLSGIERSHAGEIADAPPVFGIGEPPQNHPPRVASSFRGDHEQFATDAGPQRGAFLGGRLRSPCRRHRTAAELVDGELPRGRIGSHISSRRKPGEVEIPCLVGGGMALGAVPGNEWADLGVKAIGRSRGEGRSKGDRGAETHDDSEQAVAAH